MPEAREGCDCPAYVALREQNRKHHIWTGELQDEIKRLKEAIELMLCEIEGIEVGFENGCKGAATMVGMGALGLSERLPKVTDPVTSRKERNS